MERPTFQLDWKRVEKGIRHRDTGALSSRSKECLQSGVSHPQDPSNEASSGQLQAADVVSHDKAKHNPPRYGPEPLLLI